MVPNIESEYIFLLGYSIWHKEYYLTGLTTKKNITHLWVSQTIFFNKTSKDIETSASFALGVASFGLYKFSGFWGSGLKVEGVEDKL